MDRADAYLTIPPGYGLGLRWAADFAAVESDAGGSFVVVEQLARLLEGVFASKREEFVYVNTETPERAEGIVFKCHKKNSSPDMMAKIRFQMAKAKPVPADTSKPAPAEVAKVEQAPGELEKSVAVLSKLRDMEFHSRANIEALAGLILTIEDELKQKEFSDPISALYAAQDGFHTQIAALIESYETKCASLKPSA